jgi:methionine synthase II (cobalamin-independent)
MTEVQALQAEATRQDAIAQALRADVLAAEHAAAAITDQDSTDAGIAWARAGGLRHAMDQAIEAMRKAHRDAADMQDPDGLRFDA